MEHLKREIVSYSLGSKLLHWTIAVLVILMLSFSFFMDDTKTAFKPLVFMIHKSIGLTILALMLIRIFWILVKGRPALPSSVPIWQRVFSRIVQYSFYLLLIITPLIGWIMSTAANRPPSYFGLFTLNFPGITPNENLAKMLNEWHELIAWVLIVLLFFHVSGALKNHFWNKNEVLRRMLPE